MAPAQPLRREGEAVTVPRSLVGGSSGRACPGPVDEVVQQHRPRLAVVEVAQVRLDLRRCRFSSEDTEGSQVN